MTNTFTYINLFNNKYHASGTKLRNNVFWTIYRQVVCFAIVLTFALRVEYGTGGSCR